MWVFIPLYGIIILRRIGVFMRINNKIKTLFKNQYFIILILVFSIFVTLAVYRTFSVDTTSNIWDGTLSSNFEFGNGTINNPYEINSAKDFAYLLNRLNSDDSALYKNKYYVVNTSLDFGTFDITSASNFNGTIDFKGHAILNGKLESGLFTNLNNATIKNLRLYDVTLNNEVDAGLLANNINGGTIDNIIIHSKFTGTSKSSGIANSITNANINNVIVYGNTVTNTANYYNIANQLSGVSSTNIYRDNNYNNSSNSITVNALNTINLDTYNGNHTYYVILIDGVYYFDNDVEAADSGLPHNISGYHATGIANGTVYNNDLVADYHYLKGLNYTEIRDTHIPSGESTGYYDDEYLVLVNLTYDGTDINNSSLVPAVSSLSGESESKFVYYKYYPLARNDNGTLLKDSNNNYYLKIELLDNPFSKRPVLNNIEYGFNGCVCNSANSTSCNNVVISYDDDYYTRYIQVPISSGTNQIDLYLNATWTEADVKTSASDISGFNNKSMQKLEKTVMIDVVSTELFNVWNDDYTTLTYYKTYNRNGGSDNNYRIGAGNWYITNTNPNQNNRTYTFQYAHNNSVVCPRYTTCYIYRATINDITNGDEYEGGSYFIVTSNYNNYQGGSITAYRNNSYNDTYMDQEEREVITPTPFIAPRLHGTNSAVGYFYRVSNPTTTMINTKQYYNANGVLCTSANSCTTAYKLIQTNDNTLNSSGHSISTIETVVDPDYPVEKIVDQDRYYYLVTRDTNIFRYVSNTQLNTSNINVARPMTVTGIAVGSTNPTGILRLSNGNSSNLIAGDDLRIENIRINNLNTAGTNNTDITSYNRTSYPIYANSKNLKIGRNVTNSNDSSYLVAYDVVGGGNNGVSGSFKVIVESGRYYAYISGSTSGGGTFNEITLLGSDYDRAKKDNTKLWFIVGIDGYANGSNTAGSDSLFVSFDYILSGSFGYNSNGTPNSDNTSGAYVGGRSSLCVNSITGLKIVGGRVNTVFGGYAYNGDTDTNSTYIGMSGGSVRSIYGGAGHSTTKGNRIINVTGGSVDYSILGGSDSNSSTTSTDGIVQGDTLVYVGGTVTIGGQNNTLYGVESGSVFGAGGGNNSYDTLGTVFNSHVIINGGMILGSVYGGGNYGSTGTQHAVTTGNWWNQTTTEYASTTVVDILDGNVLNGVFGASKSAGFGREAKSADNTITINMLGGNVDNIYGGSNESGNVYGSTTVNVFGGTVGSVYGGGKGTDTYVDRNTDVIIGESTSSDGPIINNSVYGGSAFGTINGMSKNTTKTNFHSNVVINSGIVKGSVFGGGEGSNTYTPYVKGNITVTQNGGSVGNIFGSCNAAGQVNGNINVYLYGGTCGNAYGAGNRVGHNNTNVLLQGGNANYIFGGANESGNVTNSLVTVNSGNAFNIFGGNNLGGTVTTATVTTNGGTVDNSIFGGGNKAAITNATVNINNINHVINVFGGSNEANATNPIVNVANGNIDNVYGGSNVQGTVNQTHVTITGGTIGRTFGGNNLGGTVTTTNITLNGGNITSVYGGGNQVGATTTNISALKGSINTLCGGSYSQGTVNTANITVNGSHNIAAGLAITYTLSNVRAVTYESEDFETYADVSVTVKNNSSTTVNTWEGSLYLPNSAIYSNYSDIIVTYENNTFKFNQTNRWYEPNPFILTSGASKTFQFSILTNMSRNNIAFETAAYTNEITENAIKINNLFGGNDLGGSTTRATVTVTDGYVGNLYGGGNFAPVTTPSVTINNGRFNNVFGGGNNAAILTNTVVDINGGIINKNVYGGGNYGSVNGTATTTITDATVSGSAYAGGNGSTAVVMNTTMITIDGDTVIGNANETDLVKVSLFGSGNAAATGDGTISNVKSIVNIAGGTVYGNVYGGANTSKTFGSAEVNIGTNTIANTNGLRRDDIKVYGTIFGGGEANASGSEMFDWSFISVTEGININIDATNYTNFDISGSIFGSGDASSASGTSNIFIYNYGTVNSVKRNISIQRADNVILDNCYIDLHGAKDSENNYSEYIFSLSRINNLTLKNGTYLFLENSGLLVKQFNSLDSSNNKAVNVIDENGNNNPSVDNRLYMQEGNFLNIALDADATAFGEVNGMTFLGLYRINETGTVSMGIYGPSYVNGSSINWNDIFTKGTYVVGLHKNNHDITVDGYYSNFFDKDTGINKVAYIDPTEPSETVYVWSVGEVVKEYNVDLVASKYSTLGTKEVTFMDFSKPNTSYQIIGFDTSRLIDGVNLVDKNTIPRIAQTAQEANYNYGLTIESSNSGWLTNGRTTFKTSEPKISGTTYYEGENSSTIHSLLFNLYHSKNITLDDGELGTASIVVQTYHKVSPIEFELEKFIVNVNLFTKIYNTIEYEGSY